MTSAFSLGLLTGLGLIVAIGAQNAFVIRQGVRRRHVFTVAAIGTVCDVALIALGVAGVGTLIAQNVWLARIAAWGGAAFLIGFGALAAWNAIRPDHKGLDDAEADLDGLATARSRAAAVSAMLAVSLLNPHVYLDTVVLLGSIGGQLSLDGRIAFFLGAAIASTVWFFGIAYGAQALSPLFRRPAMSRGLDGFVAIVMWVIAGLLLAGAL